LNPNDAALGGVHAAFDDDIGSLSNGLNFEVEDAFAVITVDSVVPETRPATVGGSIAEDGLDLFADEGEVQGAEVGFPDDTRDGIDEGAEIALSEGELLLDGVAFGDVDDRDAQALAWSMSGNQDWGGEQFDWKKATGGGGQGELANHGGGPAQAETLMMEEPGGIRGSDEAEKSGVLAGFWSQVEHSFGGEVELLDLAEFIQEEVADGVILKESGVMVTGNLEMVELVVQGGEFHLQLAKAALVI
jgi:hypothetical protein